MASDAEAVKAAATTRGTAIPLKHLERIYAPLDPVEDEIRLLEITVDASKSSTFHLRSNISLRASKPRYIALSYPWGDIKGTRKSLRVEGERILISENLDSALGALTNYWNSQYQSHGRQFLVWIDQICINQEDEAEKNHQVAFMKNIYGQADEVVIWLPLRREHSVQRQPEGSSLSSWPNWPKNYVPRQKNASPAPNLRDLEHDQMWDDISAILTSPWWLRAWVYQEFMLASRATFLVRQHAISWQNLHTVLDQVMSETHQIPENAIQNRLEELEQEASDTGPLRVTSLRMAETIWRIAEGTVLFCFLAAFCQCSELSQSWSHKRFDTSSDLRERRRIHALYLQASIDRKTALSCWPVVQYILQEKVYRSERASEDLSLTRLISHTRRCGCTDARDRIFAVLGMADPSCGIVANYSPTNDLDKVVMSVLTKCIQDGEILNFIMALYEDKQISQDKDKVSPGWLPDLSISVNSSNSYYQFLEHLAPPIDSRASKGRKPLVSLLSGHTGQSNAILRARGRRIGFLGKVMQDQPHLQLTRFADVQGRRLEYVTRSNARTGDEVWVLLGLDMPITLSAMKQTSHYIIIGHTIIYDSKGTVSELMKGSIVDNSNAIEEDVMIM